MLILAHLAVTCQVIFENLIVTNHLQSDFFDILTVLYDLTSYKGVCYNHSNIRVKGDLYV